MRHGTMIRNDTVCNSLHLQEYLFHNKYFALYVTLIWLYMFETWEFIYRDHVSHLTTTYQQLTTVLQFIGFVDILQCSRWYTDAKKFRQNYYIKHNILLHKAESTCYYILLIATRCIIYCCIKKGLRTAT